MYFVPMLLKLKSRDRCSKLTVADGVYAHAAVMKAISEEDPEAGRRLHDTRRNKRISMALFNNGKHAASLRLTFMAEDGLSYAKLLVNALATRSTVQLGKVICEVEGVDFAYPEWAVISTWADFFPEEPASRLHIRFLTPAAITKTDGRGKRFVSLYPEPLDIFMGLVRRWNALEGPELSGDLARFIKEGGCVVSRYDLRTEEFNTKERTQIGFVGTVVYECRFKDQRDCIVALNALARLARFTGIGYQTARGMGAVQVTLSGN
jgi:CRISPR-associated endoribonuclease Cas6